VNDRRDIGEDLEMLWASWTETADLWESTLDASSWVTSRALLGLVTAVTLQTLTWSHWSKQTLLLLERQWKSQSKSHGTMDRRSDSGTWVRHGVLKRKAQDVHCV
jgi:hypothetical protein